MQYRDFGQLDFKPSALGFGAMRLPVLVGDDGKPDFKRIDYPLATEMLHRAIDGGVNYVDTAWMYHEDNCEAWLGEALQGGYRERVKLATKMPVWSVKKPSDFDRILGVQMERLRADHIDYYLLHSLGRGALEVRRRAGSARRSRACPCRRPHRPPRLQLPRHLRGLRDHPRRHRPLGVRPDPVQLHGRGVPGRPQGAGAGSRQGPRRDRHGARARRRPGAQRTAEGAGRCGTRRR